VDSKLNRKRVLGKGLGALIGDVQAATDRPASRYMLCPVSDLSPGRVQPRKSFDEASLKELSDSIREKGVIEPLIVRRNASGLEIIAGERRWRAAKMAGLKDVPVVVEDATDEESLELAVIENIQREDLNAIEEAEAFSRLAGFGMTQDEVARKVGKDRATVANYLRLLKLPHEVRDELIKGSITMGHARALLSLDGHAAQVELLRGIVTRGLSVREAEALIKKKAAPAGKAADRTRRQAHSDIEDELMGVLGTKVAVKDRRGKGSIVISYYSADERERIIEILRAGGNG
jgi:ParB family chromosome partitioning protein